MSTIPSIPEAWISLRQQLHVWRMASDSIVFTNGCFDVLHPGHLHTLNQAALQGDRLVVGLNSDASVRRLKGDSRPLWNESWRLQVLQALKVVDAAVLFHDNDPLTLIQFLKPDVLVKGGDYLPQEVIGKQEVEHYGGRLHLVPLLTGYSTSSWWKQLAK